MVAFAYEELPVRPGPHVLEVLLADGTMEPSAGPAGRQWRLRQELDIARGEAALVEFSEDAGLGVRGARPPATSPESRHEPGRRPR